MYVSWTLNEQPGAGLRSGERIGYRVEIREGLIAGQPVITKGLLGLKEGTVVRLATEGNAG